MVLFFPTRDSLTCWFRKNRSWPQEIFKKSSTYLHTKIWH